MNRKTKVGLGVIMLGIAVQFFQPQLNKAEGQANDGLIPTFHPPAKVTGILEQSCYDCHSNNTKNPWYTRVQPIGWWMTHHVNEGKQELNFDEIGTYSARRQQSKLRSIIGSIKEGSMPLPSYTWIHRNAILSKREKGIAIQWAQRTIDSLSTTTN